MAAVVKKFVITSMFMWIAPLAILFGFNHNLLPGAAHLSPYSMTLLSGFLAVISVNIVIAFYIYMAMKEPSNKHEPDPAFLAKAKASVSQSPGNPEVSSESLKKEEWDKQRLLPMQGFKTVTYSQGSVIMNSFYIFSGFPFSIYIAKFQFNTTFFKRYN